MNILLIIIGCIVIIIIGILITFMLMKKKVLNKKQKDVDFGSNDDFWAGSIRVLLNINDKNKDNVNVGIKNDNKNDNTQKHLNEKPSYNSLDMQLPPPSYNEKNAMNIGNNNEAGTSNDLADDALPVYTPFTN